MGTPSRRNSPGLTSLLIEEAYRFDFFQAVRLLQRERPERDAVGNGDDPAREAVRFRSHVTLGFPPSQVMNISPDEEDEGRNRLTQSFLGIASPSSFGALPLPYTELLLSRKRDRKPALGRFLDIFNHRLTSLFYRSWEKYRYAMEYERSAAGAHSLFERAIFSVMGMGTAAQRGRLACDDRALLARAHGIRGRSASASGLADLIRSYFRVPVRVRQFVSCWYNIEEEERCRLGRTSCRLGEDVNLGSRVRLAQSRFRLILGPLDWKSFRELLPTGPGYRPLVQMTTLAAGTEFDFDYRLVLRADAAPGLRLGVDDERGAPWLGWSTWLHNRPLADDAADILIEGDLVGAAGRN